MVKYVGTFIGNSADVKLDDISKAGGLWNMACPWTISLPSNCTASRHVIDLQFCPIPPFRYQYLEFCLLKWKLNVNITKIC